MAKKTTRSSSTSPVTSDADAPLTVPGLDTATGHAVAEMLDPQIDGVRAMVDALAERMSTLGVPPNGLPGALVAARTWDDYDLHRADTTAHLAALDLVYTGVIEDHRAAIEAVGDDPVTEDMLTGQTGELEQYQWFVRAHLQGTSGALASAGAEDEVGAARKAVGRRRS
jgi:starvation-inducible DNA-binding protein